MVLGGGAVSYERGTPVGCRVEGGGCRANDLGLKVHGSGLGVKAVGLSVWG